MTDSLNDARAPLSVRERIMARLDGDEAEDFAAILAWEDEMLALVNDLATRADATVAKLWEADRVFATFDKARKRLLFEEAFCKTKALVFEARMIVEGKTDA